MDAKSITLLPPPLRPTSEQQFMQDDLKRGVKRKIEENLTRNQLNTVSSSNPNQIALNTNGNPSFNTVNKTLQSDVPAQNIASSTNGVIGATKRKIMNASEIDRKRILHPDYFHPFASFDDSWFKLLSYHLFLFPSSELPSLKEEVHQSRWKEKTTEKLNGDINEKLEKLQDKFEQIKKKFNASNIASCNLASISPPTEEFLLLDKLCFYDEKVSFDNFKQKVLGISQPNQSNPPPPSQSPSVSSSNGNPPIHSSKNLATVYPSQPSHQQVQSIPQPIQHPPSISPQLQQSFQSQLPLQPQSHLQSQVNVASAPSANQGVTLLPPPLRSWSPTTNAAPASSSSMNLSQTNSTGVTLLPPPMRTWNPQQ